MQVALLKETFKIYKFPKICFAVFWY